MYTKGWEILFCRFERAFKFREKVVLFNGQKNSQGRQFSLFWSLPNCIIDSQPPQIPHVRAILFVQMRLEVVYFVKFFR